MSRPDDETETVHPGVEIELYALGLLEPDDVAALEAHLQTCPSCERRLRDVSETLVALDERFSPPVAMPELPIRAVPPSLSERRARRGFSQLAGAIGAMAAAAAIAFAVQDVRLSHTVEADDGAFRTLVASHFLHVPFRTLSAGAPAGKLLFAHGGRWAYAIIASDAPGLTLVRTRAGEPTVTLPLVRHGATQTAYDSGAALGDRYELRDGSGALLGTAADGG